MKIYEARKMRDKGYTLVVVRPSDKDKPLGDQFPLYAKTKEHAEKLKEDYDKNEPGHEIVEINQFLTDIGWHGK